MITTSIKISPKFLLVFSMFLNDIWFYKYHHKQNPSYPNSAKAYMDKVDVIKDFQLNPEFFLDYMPFTKASSNTSQVYESNLYL